EILEQPSFPKGEFEPLRKEALVGLERQLQDPPALATRTLARMLQPWPKGDVRYQPTIAEQIEHMRALKLEDLVAFYRNFWGGSSAELAMVGDFDVAAVEPLLQKYFGSWKSTRPFERVKRPYQAGVPGAEQRIDTPDKKMTFVAMGHAIEIRDDEPD